MFMISLMFHMKPFDFCLLVKSTSNNCATYFFDSDDNNVDMNLEDMMVMEAIWCSIQVSGQQLFCKMCAVHKLLLDYD